ncbi:MAG: hypothetical protein HQ517_08055 [SAR324 cluster bacterium]|nr:hypothetical protein [SAR324 cluster bacterium]
MKGFFYGLTAGMAAGIVAQMMVAKNHEQMLELVKNLPRSLKFSPANTLEELLAQKDTLEDLIIQKQTESATFDDADDDKTDDDEIEND